MNIHRLSKYYLYMFIFHLKVRCYQSSLSISEEISYLKITLSYCQFFIMSLTTISDIKKQLLASTMLKVKRNSCEFRYLYIANANDIIRKTFFVNGFKYNAMKYSI